MGLVINEFTRAESNVSLNSPETTLNNSNDFKILNISNLINEDSVAIPPKTPIGEPDFNFENVKNKRTKVDNLSPKGATIFGNPENQKNITARVVTNIDNTRNILDYVSQFSTEEKYSKITSSSDGVLSASRGIINLTTLKFSENKPKTLSGSIANLAGGIGSLLKAAEIPEADFLFFTGKIIGLNVERLDLRDNIQKKDDRGIAGSVVSTSKSVWGAVVSGVNVAKTAVTLGATFELVSSETYGKVTTFATKVGKIADKIAIPFAIAGTGLAFWDWRKAVNKTDKKELEITNSMFNSKNIAETNNLQNEFNTLKTNSNFMALSFAASALSTTALIASVAMPSTAIITGPVTVAFGLVSSLMSILADDKIRGSFKRN